MRRPLAVVLMAAFASRLSAQEPRPSFEEATVARVERPNRQRRQLTTTTLIDQTNLLHLIVSAYLDADGVGACEWKIVGSAGDKRSRDGDTPAISSSRSRRLRGAGDREHAPR
jgi:hypothetical protein